MNSSIYFSISEAIDAITYENPETYLFHGLKDGTIQAEGRLFDPEKTSGPYDEPEPQGELTRIPSSHWCDWEYKNEQEFLRSNVDQSYYDSIRIKKTALFPNNGGRKAQYDWTEFNIELAAYIDAFDDIPSTLNEQFIRKFRARFAWFNRYPNGGPENSDIKDRIAKFQDRYKQYLSRFKKKHL